jgi:ATP-dependent DNA ligase
LDQLQSLKFTNNTPGKHFKLFLFDLLVLNGHETAFVPLFLRRQKLDALKSTEAIEILESKVVEGVPDTKWEVSGTNTSPVAMVPFQSFKYEPQKAVIERMFQEAKKKGMEGLVLKNNSGVYLDSFREGWYKLKFLRNEDKDTLDVVVMGFDYSKVW